ncbi:hypothetical protein SAMN05444156_1570 [Verrucomicrobium sp. GAS474]|uniref:hypothetical protein n=1 Tax=Verrucomicrobium sp. GAS474 TaxID=1882831 RepID=UPI00087D1482|nr:hypothetical protein [Verrucomicrobium sp. GAS474]SDU03396.1 hypothetical protein SAMN05444156_1570 [Verrucomicrobium sp. GAS474]
MKTPAVPWLFPGTGGRGDFRAAWLAPLPLLALAALALWAFGATFYYGRIGFMPLDSPITWDGGWRILRGQVPLRDFNTPGDVIPALFQAGVFALCGVNWWGYLAHAGLSSAVFAVGVTLFLSRLGSPRAVALGAGVLEGWLFNTPKGIPYYDQYSYLFGFLALAAAVLGVTEAGVWRRRFLALVPPLVALTALSKLTPGAYIVATIPVALWLGDREGERGTTWRCLAVSAAATAAGLALLGWGLGITAGRAWESLVRLPLEMGKGRQDWLSEETVLHQLGWYFSHFRVFYFALPVAALATVLTLQPEWEADEERRRIRLLAWIACCAPGIDVLAQLLSSQGNINYQAFAPLGLGAGLTAGLVAAGRLGGERLARGRRWRVLYVAILALLAVRMGLLEWGSSWKIRERQVTLLGQFPKGSAVEAYPRAGRELRPLIWVESSPGESPATFWQGIDFLRTSGKPFLLAGRNTLPYALCGQVNPFPAAWYHEGLTFPKAGDRRREAFDARAKAMLKAAGVRWIAVQDGDDTALALFPFLREWASRGGHEERLGSWRFIQVDPGLLQ